MQIGLPRTNHNQDTGSKSGKEGCYAGLSECYGSVVSTLDCCACPLCKADIIAYALNQLPPKYVALREGEAYPKLFILQKEYRTRVAAALVHAAAVVRENPRHGPEDYVAPGK